MNANEDLHIHDTELEALCRRGYQGGMPIELLSDAYVFEEHGCYFHTVDGRFAKIWRIGGIDGSLLDDAQLKDVCFRFSEALNKFPEGSDGSFIRHTHRDIRGIMDTYANNLRGDNGEFANAIAESILERQYNAAISPNGFFTKLTDSFIQQMRQDAIDQLNGAEDDVRANVTTAVNRDLDEGRFPYVSQFYLIVKWEPSYVFGKFIDSRMKSALASVGLADADELAYNSYTKHARQFGEMCNKIAQALAAQSFAPEELNGQGFINWQYQLINPIRSYNVEPPFYRADIPVYECLKDPSLTPSNQKMNSVPAFAHVTTQKDGWTIHDSGYDYYVKAVSVIGKPKGSVPGMLQIAMTGIECESLITINWTVPNRVVVAARLIARGKLISSKRTMKLGEKDVIEQQATDLEAVRGKISAENVSGREQMFDVGVHINLMGFDEAKLQDQADKLETLLWRIGKAENLRGDAIVRSSMPLNYNPNSRSLLRRDTPHMTESLSHLCPLFIEYQGVADPAILMNNRAGQPIFLDLWGSNVLTAHSLIVGTTGSGKSFTFNNILMGAQVKYKPKVWIIDKGNSYESLCLVLGGNYIRLAEEPFQEAITGRTIYPICINPFWVHKDEDGSNVMPSKSELMFLADMLVLMMTTGNGDRNAFVHTKTKPLLFNALYEFFSEWVETKPKEEPIFSDFIPTLAKFEFSDLKGQDMVEKLVLYYGQGPYAALFDGHLQVDWDNDFTVLEIERMSKSDALSIVTLALFRQIELYCKYKLDKEHKKLVAVDEAWATLSDPASAAALASFYRELRKYKGGALLISQTVGDFVKILKAEAKGTSDTQEGILENTSHYFFLACSESDYRLAQSELAFSDDEIDLWRSLASLPPLYSEVFYRMRTKQSLYYSGVFRLFASSVSLWIASSSPEDYAMRERKTQEIVHTDGVDECIARQRAIVALSKQYPYGARFYVEEAA